jgi:CheY-like chemotaxis protein/anti-sigma regulatory factor (Ser/Thr protein kinase)
VELAPRPVDVGAVTAQVASSFAGLCERIGIELVIRCAPVSGHVDGELWETIVLNLLSNAVKFTYHGSITVTVEERAGGGSVIRVADTGTGIAEADLGRLFERFYRASNTRGRSVEGSGIGLSLVRSLVELHGGTVSIDSALGTGTTVTIELPEGTAPEPVADSSGELRLAGNAFVAEAEQWLDPPAPARRDTGRALVLIADDNADMRAHLDRILSQRWDTIAVGDGQAALDAVRLHRPDLVVTDVMMPLLDGFAFVQALRQDAHLAATPVLMLSARAGAEAAGDGFAAGADDYLTKPFSSAELLQRAEARLNAEARHRARQAEREAHARHGAAVSGLLAAISAADSIDAVLAALLSGPLGAPAAAIAECDPDNGHLTVHYGGIVDPELRARYHRIAEDAPVPLADVVNTGQPMVIPDTGAMDPRYDQLVRDARPGIQAAVFQPLHHPSGAVTGAVALLWPRPRAFDQPALRLITEAAAATGQALARIATAAQEHRIAIGFQEHLLDLDRGSTGAVVAAAYQPASETMRVGGDWYVTIPVRPGLVSVCVGDVVGHGLPAATVMGNLRAAVAATALSRPDPAHVLTTVQRYAATVPGARCCSLAYAAVDTAAGTIDYLCAGHPFPLLVTRDGAARFLNHGRLPPLAAFTGVSATSAPGRAALPPGSLLILYTDGLVERRGESLDRGFDRLRAAAAGCATLPADLVCDALLTQLAPPDGYSDDVAILALRPVGVTADSFVTVLPAAAVELAPLRRRLGDWLDQLGADSTLLHNVLIAAGEAVVNAIEHGSEMDATRTISVEAFAGDAAITLSVTDTGRWRRDTAASRRSGKRGRGLTLMHGMSDRVDTVRGRQGTTVTLHFQRFSAHVAGAPM